MNDEPAQQSGLEDFSCGFDELAEVRDCAVRLLEQLARQPSGLRIQAGDIAVEIAWPADQAAAPGEHRDVAAGAESPDLQAPQAEPGDYLTSPAVGVFYHASEPGAEPFVSVGSAVRSGQQIGIIEAMKLMMSIEADKDCVITDVLIPNGTPVEYDQPLFAVRVTDR
jgi:acetyl-CoA carboxylase biotin carboxyl carrier protein